jgi:hypothetical protein
MEEPVSGTIIPFKPDSLSEQGTVTVCGQVWNVDFIDVLRDGQGLLIECLVVGPTTHHVTIRCAERMGVTETARRVMSTLSHWLAADEPPYRAHLAVQGPLAAVN